MQMVHLKTFFLYFLLTLLSAFAVSGILLASFYSEEFYEYQQADNHIILSKKLDPQYKKFYEKGLNRGYILEIKNSQLEVPIDIDDALLCIKNISFESFKVFDKKPKIAFQTWMNYCSFHDFSQQVIDKKEQELQKNIISTLRENMHYSGDALVPESLITDILNTKNWDGNTQTLLGNQQGISHVLTNQSENLKDLGITELLGVGLSTYYHSSDSRKVNLRNAAKKLHGKIIHPGESFSLVTTLSPFTYGNGYINGIIIKDGKDATAMGGGVCQSVTTIFRAWQNSGLEITKFQPHSKSISYYGGIGFDATMYSSGNSWGNVDLVLKNNTENSILIEVIDRDPYQIILLYGTQDRKVTLDRYYFGKYRTNQVAKWKRSIEYNNSGEWVDNYFNENQGYY